MKTIRRSILALLLTCGLLMPGCASITKSIIRSMLGLDDKEECRDPHQHLYDAGYGFNNPNAEKNRRERLKKRGLLPDDPE